MEENTKKIKELNGQTITLGELIDSINALLRPVNEMVPKIYVPMYQRNYKWNKETAVKLTSDLIEAFKNKSRKSISLFTLYIDSANNIQVVDGQQRLITLMLLFTAMNKKNEFINLQFERDFELDKDKKTINRTRLNFINTIDGLYDLHKIGLDEKFVFEEQGLFYGKVALTDKRRFWWNYKWIFEALNKEDSKKEDIKYDEFINYIRNNVSLLLHITEDEPVSEFLNLNCNKTKFSICDRVRSALITYPTFNTISEEDKKIIEDVIESIDYKEGISNLFEEITRLLYIENIYDTVKLGYDDPIKMKENRINIMFSTLVNNSYFGYTDCKKIEADDVIGLLRKLYFYKLILTELEQDFQRKSYVTANAFVNFYKFKKVKFFDLIDRYLEKTFKKKTLRLSEILHKEHSIDYLILDYIKEEPKGEESYFINSYFEVLADNSDLVKEAKSDSIFKEILTNKNKGGNNFFAINKNTLDNTLQCVGKYVLYRYIEENKIINDFTIKFPPKVCLNKDKSISKDINQENRIESKITIKELLNKVKREIIIPVIQRDYCMGSHFDKNGKKDMLDFIIDSFIDNKENQITLSAITIHQPNNYNIYIYDGQQRVVTLACLIKLLNENTEICKFNFEYREKFNFYFRDLRLQNQDGASSYAESSISNLKNTLKKKMKNKNILRRKEELKEFILNKINLDVITVSGEISSAEQFFMEINDGVQLVPYEIFKCKINDKFKQITNEDSYEKYIEWITLIDNQWLDFFYWVNSTEVSNEKAEEELMEMRIIEFCSRMIYWEKFIEKNGKDEKEKHPLNLHGFSNTNNAGDIGDCDWFIDSLEFKDFERIMDIMNRLIKLNNLSKSEEIIKFTGIKHYSEVEQLKFTIPYWDIVEDKDKAKRQKNNMINKFIESLCNDDYQQERYRDVVMWSILNNLPEDNDGFGYENINKVMESWNTLHLEQAPFAYLTPSFIGKYEYSILPIPTYYYDTKKYINIYSKIHVIKNEVEIKNYNNLISGCEPQKVECSQKIEYEIYYKYSHDYFCKEKYKAKSFQMRDDCLLSKSDKSYRYFEKRSNTYFKKTVLEGKLEEGSDKVFIEGFVFKGTEKPYFLEIKNKSFI